MTSPTTTITTRKILAICIMLSIGIQMSHGSSIPIWEFLIRNQKISYLYSSFAQLVSVHCKATAAKTNIPINQCKHDLLAYGYEKLQTFSNSLLDTLDPYQRHASSLIWTSIMRDHTSFSLFTTRQPVPTPPASSLIILTHQTSNGAGVANSGATISPDYPVNPLFEQNSAEQKHQYAMDMDMTYGYSSSPNAAFSNSPVHQTFLSGPHVVRVRPDGTPVQEDRHLQLPRDDDHSEQFQAASSSSVAKADGKHHRKIASINAIKTQHLSGVLQQQLQPPFEQSRQRRTETGGYHYARGS